MLPVHRARSGLSAASAKSRRNGPAPPPASALFTGSAVYTLPSQSRMFCKNHSVGMVRPIPAFIASS